METLKLFLTSFGVPESIRIPPVIQRFQGGHVAAYPANLGSERMPPVNMRAVGNTFMPDYAALLLCDKVILDTTSFALLTENPHPWYATVGGTMKTLYDEGFIELVDFSRILTNNQSLLKQMLEHDLQALEQWITPLLESVTIWNNFISQISGMTAQETEIHETLLHRAYSEAGFLSSYITNFTAYKELTQDLRGGITDILKSYMSYVNANIVLSNELDVGFHDWADFAPFYQHKFLYVGRENLQEEQTISASQALFEISFPEFAVQDNKSLLRVLQDKRIVDLRRLVQDSVDGKVMFDEQFARNILHEVLSIEKKSARYRKVVSYLTMPLGFLPVIGIPVQKLAEETIGMVLDKRLQKNYRWFYMLSDVGEAYK